ncbi:MAG: hypothetical protein K2Q45_03280 [Nitrosomonas sp.]|nr:hypothetical protein [Nitrosomonas sp.]
MHDEYVVLRHKTERSVGKYELERIVCAHSVALIDAVIDGGAKLREVGSRLKSLEQDWANAILVQMGDGGGGSAAEDNVFEKVVRTMVEKFFAICNKIIEKESVSNEEKKIGDQIAFYLQLTSARSRRAAKEMTNHLQDYVATVRNMVAVKDKKSDAFYTQAISCMYQASQLGFFLDMQLSL